MNLSVVVLTYMRENLALKLAVELQKVEGIDQIIFVDNSISLSLKALCEKYRNMVYVKGDNKNGTYSRNLGINSANGEIVICIDDDIFGLNAEYVKNIKDIFLKDKKLGAACFKVVTPNGYIVNWCHHCRPEEFGEREFKTFEISEGAVAFRKVVFDTSGYFPSNFFISHEGLDLALRIIEADYNIIYTPCVKLIHYHESSGRKSWRRYYYDTRNLFLIWSRNFPFWYGSWYAVLGLIPMMIYSIRDGFFFYHLKGIIDGIVYLLKTSERNIVSPRTLRYIRNCKINKPSIFYLIKKRLFKRGIRI